MAGARHQVQRGRVVLPVEVPAARLEDIADRVDIVLARADRNDAHVRLTPHVHAVDRRNAVDEPSRCLHHVAGEPEIPLFAEVLHDCPCGADGRSRLRAEERLRAIDPAGPVVELEHLVAHVRPRAVQDHGRALHRISILVHIRGDRTDACDAEVPRWNLISQTLEEREQEAAEARVDVEWHSRR